MPSTGTGLRRTVAKGLGISDHEKKRPVDNQSTQHALDSTGVDGYVEDDATVNGWLKGVAPKKRSLIEYPKSLFPFVHWIGNYNLQWLAGDLVAGITVGAVVVPQSMAYAQLAELPVEYGLYTSFMGVLIYFFFATSKDITIGVSLFSLDGYERRTDLHSLWLSCLC